MARLAASAAARVKGLPAAATAEPGVICNRPTVPSGLNAILYSTIRSRGSGAPVGGDQQRNIWLARAVIRSAVIRLPLPTPSTTRGAFLAAFTGLSGAVSL